MPAHRPSRRFATVTVAVMALAIMAIPILLRHRSRPVPLGPVAVDGTASFGQPADWRALTGELSAAVESGEAERIATVRARMTADALRRALAVHDAWMALRDPATGLFPQSPRYRQWNYRNTAADFFSFQFAIAMYSGDASLPRLRDTLRRERAFNPPPELCLPVDLDSGRRVAPQRPDPMFTTSEYVKDGLIGLFELTGDAQVYDRLVELADSLVANAAAPSGFGPIPSWDSEVNGNVLQALSRLSFTTDKPAYADLVGRLGDAVVEQMLRATGGLPVVRFDYAAVDSLSPGRPRTEAVQLRDHGNETAVGMSEAYALAVTRSPHDPAWADRARRWAEPLARMYELILTRGVNDRGLLMNRIAAGTFEPLDAEPCDNWGYLLCGALLFCQAADRHGAIPSQRLEGLLDRVDGIARAVAATDALPWEGAHHDGWADTIESAIYIASHRPSVRAQLLDWVDGQIGYLFGCQRSDGFVSGDYLDGNFIRTAMLYAHWHTGGLRLEPHTPGCGIGLHEPTGGTPVVVVVGGQAGFEGRIVLDTPRARDRLRLPWNWPRLNSWPERTVARSSPSAGVQMRVPPGGHQTLTLDQLGIGIVAEQVESPARGK